MRFLLSEGVGIVHFVAMRDSDDLTSRRLVHRIQLIEALESHMDGRHWDLAAPGSELDGDDTLTAPFQTSHLVGHCLSISLEGIRTTRFILQDHDPENASGIRLPMAGHYPALRSAIEAGAEALWLMEPDDRRERVSRTLRARWDDIIEDNKVMLALTSEDKNDAKDDVRRKQQARKVNSNNVRTKKKRIREVATKAGIPHDEMFLAHPGFGPVVEEAADVTGVASNYQYGMWRLISGLTHPSASRSLAMSVVKEMGESKDGTFMAEMTASTQLTVAALDAALLLHWHALNLAAKRGGREEYFFSAPPDIPLPPGWVRLFSGPQT